MCRNSLKGYETRYVITVERYNRGRYNRGNFTEEKKDFFLRTKIGTL